MGRIRRNKGTTAIVVGLLAVALAFAIDLVQDGAHDSARPQPSLGVTPDDPEPDVYRAPSDATEPAAAIGERVADARSGTDVLGSLGPGLQGSGGTKDLPKRRITLTMRSTAPIGVIGYVVPTSLDRAYGVVKDAGTTWTVSTIGYGSPDYAQLFAQSGPSGAPITCTITVDGAVTESRSTDGPYSQLFCQG